MKKIIFIFFVLIIAVAFGGCIKRIDYTLPENPIEFNNGTFVVPDNEDDTYLSFEYNGRTYICYGTLNFFINGNDVGKCLGYYVQDGEKDENMRIFLLAGDEDENFLVRIHIGGIMDQPDFFRAIDTRYKDIEVPRCIRASETDRFWK